MPTATFVLTTTIAYYLVSAYDGPLMVAFVVALYTRRRRWGALLPRLAVVTVITVGSQAEGSATATTSASAGLAGDRAAVEGTLETVSGLPSIAEVRSPYADPYAVSEDGTIGYATVVLDARVEEVPKEDVTRIIDTARSAAGAD